MNTIDEYHAPRGYIAAAPEESSHDGIGGCNVCALLQRCCGACSYHTK